MAASPINELEKFRQQWQDEVKAARSKVVPASTSRGTEPPHHDASPCPNRSLNESNTVGCGLQESADYSENVDEPGRVGETGQGKHANNRLDQISALDHYEKGVESEIQSNLGDSLAHYRKAYRLDAGVHQAYRNKHFPASPASKPTSTKVANIPASVPGPAHHVPDRETPSTTSQLIASFSSLSIPPAEPPTDQSARPPCPLSELPSEILMNILLYAAIADVASFTRLSLVCKSLAHLVTREDSIWRRICLGNEVGFSGMHYQWALTISGQALPRSVSDCDQPFARNNHDCLPEPLPLSTLYPTYKEMLHARPRIRFNGAYISTVNYIRPGAATASQATWNTPVLIVRYYRYLRFFRDGTCISLLTTNEPGEVVHHLTKDNLHSHHSGGAPSASMNHALRGRWKLSGNPYDSDPGKSVSESTLRIETEGVDADRPNPKYVYSMMLELKHARKGCGQTRNNKLSWLGYWSYNKLTDDWAEFGLKNDRAFLWSRVKSYGDGE